MDAGRVAVDHTSPRGAAVAIATAQSEAYVAFDTAPTPVESLLLALVFAVIYVGDKIRDAGHVH